MPSHNLKPASLVMVSGDIGAGKSWWWRSKTADVGRLLVYTRHMKIVQHMQRLAYIPPRDDKDRSNWTRAVQYIDKQRRASQGFRVVILDPNGKHRTRTLKLIAKLQNLGLEVDPPAPLWVVMEESHHIIPREERKSKSNKEFWELMSLIFRNARHHKLCIVFASQQTDDLPKSFRKGLTRVVFFRLGMHDNLVVLAEFIGRKQANRAKDFKTGEHGEYYPEEHGAAVQFRKPIPA